MGRLSGRVALVTGGARGQGRSHALAMAEEGADVVVCDICVPSVPPLKYPLVSRQQLDETLDMLAQHGGRRLGIVADLRETQQAQAVVDQTISMFGRLDILVANHGVVTFTTVEETTDDEWNTVVDTNLTGIFKILRASLAPMRAAGFGRIVLTSSSAARVAHPNVSHYTAAKWG